jgi:hypothetical protein
MPNKNPTIARLNPACIAISGEGSTAYRVASPSNERANPIPRGVRTLLGLRVRDIYLLSEISL